MSRVYEALRQQEQETSTLPRKEGRAGEILFGLVEAVSKGEPVANDEALRATVVPAEEECRPRQKFVSQLPLENVRSSTRAISTNGFRRLKLPQREESRLVFHTDPHGLAAEQYRFVRRTLEQDFRTGKVLLITSPAPGDGKTLTSLNLCACLADSGRSTLLVEGDLRQPAVQKVLGVTNTTPPGIEDTLAGKVDPGQVVHFVEDLSMFVAMVAQPPADPSRLIRDGSAKQFLAWAREHFDWVLIDSPPVLPAADVAELVTFADAVLLVLRAQRTPIELATRAFELLGEHLCGVVLNEATIDSNPYYRYLAHFHQKSGSSNRRGATSV